MSEEELTKEQKLELARKKFDEIKKNKKKGKKKGKKAAAKQDENSGNEDTVGDVEDAPESGEKDLTEEVNSSEKQTSDQEKETADAVLETADEVVEASDVKEENISDVDEKETEIDESVEAPVIEESETEKTETSPKQLPVDQPTESEIEATIEVESELPSKKNTLPDTPVTNKPKESAFLNETFQSTIKELTEQNEQLTQEVSNYKSENLELKLSKMDLEMELETLKNELETQKAQVKRLTQQLQTAKTDSRTRMKSPENDDGVSVLSGTEYLHSPSSFANLTAFNVNNASQDYMDIVDAKERLAQWKNWNMDMHGWRSIGMGPVMDV